MTTFGEAVALDTTIVIQHLRYPALVAERMADYPRLYLPFAALGELYLGIHRSANSDRNLAKLRKFLENVAILRCEDSTCAEYGRIAARLTTAGKLIHRKKAAARNVGPALQKCRGPYGPELVA